MNENQTIYDIIIIGGGPGGLAAALYGGRARLKTLVLEKEAYGGSIRDTADVNDYPGIKHASGLELSNMFQEHAASYSNVEFKLTGVQSVHQEGEYFVASTKHRGDFYAKSIIFAMGTVPRQLGIPGETEFYGQGVSYCAICDSEFYKDKVVYVLGVGDQGIEGAIYLSNYASKVYVIAVHEPKRLDCNATDAEDAFNNSKIEFIWNSTLTAIKGKDRVDSLVIKNMVTGKEETVPADAIFMFVGMVPETSVAGDLVKKDSRGYIVVNDLKETSVPGVYAIGDCTETILRQVITAAADGAIAATEASRFISEKNKLLNLIKKGAGKVAFIFYSPYDTKDLATVNSLIGPLQSEYKVVRQDITREKYLYGELKLTTIPSVALYDDGELKSTITDNVLENVQNLLKH